MKFVQKGRLKFLYSNAVARLHAQNYQLIGIDAQETAFTEVWYCKTKLWFSMHTAKSAVMLAWESTDGGQMNMRTWQL